MKIELLDLLAAVVLASIVLLAYVLLSPTALQQQESALHVLEAQGGNATFLLNVSAVGGYRQFALELGDIHFIAPAGWNYHILSPHFVLSSSGNFTDMITISVPSNASVGNNATLSMLLYASGNPSVFSRNVQFVVTASTSSLVEESGELLTVSVTGLSFVPWYAVVGPLSLITVMVAVALGLSKH
ncbi:MAG: hypothetical protein QXP70_03205 [Methanomassiliicoccales archaeon]